MISCHNLSLGWGSKIILAGKSTLIKALLGLITPLSGKIFMPEGAGYLPQQAEVVLSGCLGRLGWRAFFSCPLSQR